MGSGKTIALKDYSLVRNEALANNAITPGQLVELTTTSGDVQRHSTAGGFAEKAFALEDELQGKQIGDDYANNTKVQYNIFSPGDVVNALLADGQTAVVGSKLASNGDGDLKIVTPDSSGTIVEDYVVAVALEALDMSDSSGADPSSRRISVRVV